MNRYSLGELEVGLTESFKVSISAEMLESFREITGDINPLHCDEGFAKARGFSGRVAYGMLVASLYSTLAGVYLPGERCLLHEVDAKFKKPVFIGDELTVSGSVSEINEAFSRLEISARIVNQKGETVNRARIIAGVID
ncbi:MAG: MaoC family dehydratase [Oscillospiraceae bacterium]|nr:MaoC family dehydratase [Oscillospiraceae bacterium]